MELLRAVAGTYIVIYIYIYINMYNASIIHFSGAAWSSWFYGIFFGLSFPLALGSLDLFVP